MSEPLGLSENELALFCDVSAAIHTIRDMDSMLTTILDKISSLFHLEGASIALHDPGNREFYFIQTVEGGGGTRSPHQTRKTFADNQGIAGWVMENNRSDIINDVSQDSRFFSGLDVEETFVTKSMVCVPLRSRKGFLGVLYALNKQDGVFTERDRKSLEILSGSIAVSIENAKLYGELQDHVHLLEREKRILESQVRSVFGFKEIIGVSQPMRRMFTLLEKVIDTPTSVLIQGETGTGKELIAKVIHYNGPLKDKPFVAENCGALPESLLESELFGHVKGAFTGALTNKKGLFEIADGGTMFLDELGEMSPHMQVKLLRVLQDGQFRPVGSSQVHQVKVRLIASTNRDLDEEVKKGNFREDLYFRVNVFQVTPPPLRERSDDIHLLAEHFLAKYAGVLHREVPKISPSSLELLMRYDWPGNVRELENEMERAVAMAAGEGFIHEELLSDKIRRLRETDHALELAIFSGTLKEAVHKIESRMIRDGLEASGGNRSKAAKALGLSRQGLLNKITAYRIEI